MKCDLFYGAAMALLLSAPAQAAETITYKYDAKGRLIEVKRTGTVNNNVTTTYTHDKADNRKNVTTTGSPNAPPPP
jgi:YD repeat-containing protein